MTDKNQSTGFFSEYAEAIKSQVEDRLLLLRLNAIKITSNLLSKILIFFLIIVLTFLVILFLSVMLAFYLSEIMHSYYWGFGCIGGFYLLLLLISIFFKQALFGRFIMGSIINSLFDKNDENTK